MYTIELVCEREPYICRCRHNPNVEVDSTELTQQLISHNPQLAKYLSRPDRKTQQTPPNRTENNQPLPQPYRSIAEEKGLRYLTSSLHKEPQPVPQSREEEVQTEQGGFNTQSTGQGNKSPKNRQKTTKGKSQGQVQGFYKKLRNESRYLSDTGFRKYFDRQVFENYGNANTHNHNDGFVYGNYLKTHNINPHTNQNMPQTQQTFYQALRSASPERFNELRGHVMRHGEEAVKEAGQGQRGALRAEQMLGDNMKHNSMVGKYSRLKLVKSQEKSHHVSTVQRSEYLQSQNHHEQSYKQHRVKEGQRHYSRLEINTNPNIRPILKEPDNSSNMSPKPTHANQVSIVEEHPSHPEHPASTSYQQIQLTSNPQTSSKKVMRGAGVQAAQGDPDLAARVVSSAKKSTRYKNYTIDNGPNAALNPKNIAEDGRLDTYKQM